MPRPNTPTIEIPRTSHPMEAEVRSESSVSAAWAALLLGCVLGIPMAAKGQSFLITEFSAANSTGLRDVDGDTSDWLEIYNAGTESASIGGWYLSDDPDNLTRWELPAVSVPAQGFLVVFASGKDRRDPAGQLHANFSLSRDGEYLALTHPDGVTIGFQYSPTFPRQVSDVTYGVRMETETRVYIEPDADLRWWVPADDPLGLDWTEPEYNDREWGSGAAAIGYHRAGSSTNSPAYPTHPVPDITQPQDPILATSQNSPASEGVRNAIDGSLGTKYLNFDTLNAGFFVTPEAGLSVVTGLRFTSANDAPERDPTRFELSGSNDGQQYTLVAEGPIPEFLGRFFTVEVPIAQAEPYLHYRILFPEVRDADAALAMQIAEVELVGLIGDPAVNPSPRDVTAPGDSIEATSYNSPSNEGVTNVIDNDPQTKYLNFDTLNAGFTVMPEAGESVVTGLRLTSANDAPDRDPTSYVLTGSNDGQNFVPIAQGPIPEFTERFETVGIELTNSFSYTHYRLVFPTVRNASSAVAMQIAEVGFLGTIGPTLPALEELIRTDLEAEMFEQHSSVYVRIPFTVEPADPLEALALQVRYDDGFIAYLNGVEVARANAPANAAYNSEASEDRPLASALRWERFSLAAATDLIRAGTNVLAVHALNDQADSSEFLFQARLENTRVSLAESGYFDLPTPGAPNAPIYPGLAADPIPSHPHGFYESPFWLTLTTPTSGAVIRYTTDGSAPTAATGQPYEGGISIDRTTVLRAAAFREDWLPSPVVTATYLFLEDVVTQDHQAALAAGFPASWNGQPADYGLDPQVIGPDGQDEYGGKYTDEFRASLRSLPAMSIVMDVDDMFGTLGIYANPVNRGDSWERTASFELLFPDQPGGFQQDAGIRIQGGAFRRFDLTLKKSFRIIFRGRYGAGKLAYPLFGPDAAAEFDNIILRANSNDAWPWGGADSLYIRDAFAQETLRAMGGIAPHSNFVHLYINGLYWGLYNPVERPDASFSASYFGGDEDTWDAINQDSVPDGNYDAWNRLLGLLSQDVGTDEAYQRLQGNNPDGTRNPAYEDLLDVDNMIDYMILNLYVGNVDWPDRNYWVGRDRNDGDGFKFYPWDSETALGLGSGVTQDRTGVNSQVAQPYAALRNNADFLMRFADRVYRHFSKGGALYVEDHEAAWDPAHPEQNRPAARLVDLADRIDSAMVSESARWGDQLNNNPDPYTRDEHWRAARDHLLASYLPRRSYYVMIQFRVAGLYPRIDPPTFNHPGGQVETGFLLTMAAEDGTIYYTLDGTDPRNSSPGGAAQAYTEPIALTDLTPVKARLLDGAEWSAVQEATFIVGSPRLAVTELNYHPYNPSPTEIAAGFSDDNDFEYIEFFNAGTVTIDLNGVHFTDGVVFGFTGSDITLLAPGQCVLVVRNRAAFEMRYGSGLPVAGEYAGAFSNGGERVALADAAGTTILEFEYGTGAPWPAAADGDGPTLERHDLDNPVEAAESWRASSTIGGSPGFVSLANPIRIDAIARQGDSLRTLFNPQPGHTYVLYARDALDAGSWTPIPSPTNHPGDISIDIPENQPSRFFRIVDVIQSSPE